MITNKICIIKYDSKPDYLNRRSFFAYWPDGYLTSVRAQAFFLDKSLRESFKKQGYNEIIEFEINDNSIDPIQYILDKNPELEKNTPYCRKCGKLKPSFKNDENFSPFQTICNCNE